MSETTIDQICARAKDAYRFGYSMVESYRTQYAQAIDTTDPRYIGGYGTYRHYRDPATPANKDIVTPNNDTPYSWLWLDLRAEPTVITVPESDRYYVIPISDMYTLFSGYVGTRTTGAGAGSYLIAGPDWEGETPTGVAGVIRVSTQFAMSLTRTELTADGPEGLARAQEGYRVESLSSFLHAPAPEAAAPIAWPAWDEEAAAGLGFFDTLDFLLQFAPVLDEDAVIRADMASIGLDGSRSFSTASLTPEVAAAFAAGQAEAVAEMNELEKTMLSNIGVFGTREEMAGNYDMRNQGTKIGIYGLPPAESWYGGWMVDHAGQFLQGSPGYTVTFTADELPNAQFFWSATLYTLPIRYLSANPINRYSIGDRTEGLVYGEDGSLTLAFTHEEPTDPTLRANWLPAPDGPFTVILRAYGGDEAIVTGAYRVPLVQAVSV